MHFPHLLLYVTYCFDSKERLPKLSDSENYFKSASSVNMWILISIT